MKSTFLKCLATAMLSLAFAAPGYADFSGTYALPWVTTTGAGGTGGTSVDISGAPNSLVINGGDDSCFFDCQFYYSAGPTGTGNVTFAWAFSTEDAGFEVFGYGVNNAFTTLAANTGAASGSESVAVNSGDTFTFFYDCTDCISGPGQASIREFDGPDGDGTIPEPASLALLGIGLLGLGASRLRARRR